MFILSIQHEVRCVLYELSSAGAVDSEKSPSAETNVLVLEQAREDGPNNFHIGDEEDEEEEEDEYEPLPAVIMPTNFCS